jgi:hypothetical protein
VGLALQADEYGVGPISGPASAVAKMAGAMRKVPYIGKFATATEMGANAVVGIAKLFGFTNVPVIEPAIPFRPSPFPQLASPEIGYPVEKLTMDSKNELSIDPTIVGLPADDELAIQTFAGRQSYLCSSSWTTATSVDSILFGAKVNPMLGWGDTTTGARTYMTPLSLIAQMFKSWRGDIIFTFRFVASPFHKGRVRISYDPYGSTVQATADTGPTVFNRIVDLGAETEVDVRIPYQQALAWCYNYTYIDNQKWQNTTAGTLSYTDTFDNGIITVKVLTALSAPVATSTVNMQVFVRGADNIEFANPSTVAPFYSPFVLQSEEYSEKREGELIEMGHSSPSMEAQRARVHFGENVRSLRQLMRRSNLIDTWSPVNVPTGTGTYVVNQTRFPLYYGYDPSGWNVAKGVNVPASNFPVNIVNMSPWHYIANCFIGQRGSVHWHFNVYRNSNAYTMRAVRDTGAFNAPNASFLNGVLSTTSQSVNTYNQTYACTPTSGGAALVNTNTNAGLSVSVPNYSAFKFESTDPLNSSDPTVSGGRYDGSVYEGLAFEVDQDSGNYSLAGARIERYFGIGTDYTLHFFLNCPVLYALPETSIVPV